MKRGKYASIIRFTTSFGHPFAGYISYYFSQQSVSNETTRQNKFIKVLSQFETIEARKPCKQTFLINVAAIDGQRKGEAFPQNRHI